MHTNVFIMSAGSKRPPRYDTAIQSRIQTRVRANAAAGRKGSDFFCLKGGVFYQKFSLRPRAPHPTGAGGSACWGRVTLGIPPHLLILAADLRNQPLRIQGNGVLRKNATIFSPPNSRAKLLEATSHWDVTPQGEVTFLFLP